MSKKTDFDIVLKTIDDKNRNLGRLKRKSQNEAGYIFGQGKEEDISFQKLKNIGFNVRYFVREKPSSSSQISIEEFTWDESYVTYFIRSINGNFIDANLTQYSRAIYTTELFSTEHKTLSINIRMNAENTIDFSAFYSLLVNGSVIEHGKLYGETKTIPVTLIGGAFTQVTLLLYTPNELPRFELSGDLGSQVDSWRLPPPITPRWVFGYPTSRLSQHEIELKWDTPSLYSVGDSARTIIEYATESGGTFSELTYTDYDTRYFMHGALGYGTEFWYRLKTIDITANETNYSEIKNGSTLPGTFPDMEITTYKDNVEWQYYKSGDTLDIHAASAFPLNDYPNVYAIHDTQATTGTATCYGTNELNTYSTHYYLAVYDSGTVVSGSTPAQMPEGRATITAVGNIFGTSGNDVINILANAALEQRYLLTGVDIPYVVPSGWTRSGESDLVGADSVERPSYVSSIDATGKMGMRYFRVGGPGKVLFTQSGEEYYTISGARYQQTVSGYASGDYCISTYCRINSEYNASEYAYISRWQPKICVEFLDINGGVLSETSHAFSGSTDWTRQHFTINDGDFPDSNYEQMRFVLTSEKSRNYICDGCFLDADNWWTISSPIYSQVTTGDAALNSCLYVSSASTHSLSPSGYISLTGMGNFPITIGYKIKHAYSTGVNFDAAIHYNILTDSGWQGYETYLATGEIYSHDWSDIRYTISGADFPPNSEAILPLFTMEPGEYYLTEIQLVKDSGIGEWIPGDLQVEFDGLMVETGTTPSQFRTSEAEYGVWSVDASNKVYFDYTVPTGEFYISAIDDYTSNNQQIATRSRSTYLIPTGPFGTGYPYDKYGIRYIYFVNSGDCFPVGDPTGTGTQWTQFNYAEGVPYAWTIDESGYNPAGTGTGIRKVFCKMEDMAGNVTSIFDDTILYTTGILPAPSGLTATGEFAGANDVAWLPVTGSFDPHNLLDYYEAYSWAIEGNVYDAQLSVWRAQTSSTGARHAGVNPNTSYYYSVRCVDVLGQPGEWATYEEGISYDYNDDVPPAAPFVSGLTSSGIDDPWGGYNIWIDAEIGHSGENENPPGGTCSDLHSIECGLRKSGEDSYVIKNYAWDTAPAVFPTGVDFRFDRLEADTQYYISARALDFAGNPSVWCSESGVLSHSDLDVPAKVGWFTLYGVFEKVVLNWELMSDWGAKQFILLRGDYSTVQGVTNGITDSGESIIDTFSSPAGISGGYLLVIDPDYGPTEGRYIVKEVNESAKTIEIFGKANISHTGGSPFIAYRPLANPYRGPYTDTDCEVSTTYYYNVMAVDLRHNVSSPYGSTNLSSTGDTEWPSATTKSIESVDVAWDFLSDITTLNKVKNSSFEIQSGGESTVALFWERTGGGSFRETLGSAPYGDYVAGLSTVGHIIISDPFPVESGTDYVLSFYAYSDTGPVTDKIKGKFQYWTGSVWTAAIDIIDTSSAIQTWERFSLTGSTPAIATSGRVVLYGDTSDINYDGVMVQQGSWLSQYIPYSDEFVLGTAQITSTEITSGAIQTPHIAANTIIGQHILAGAIGAYHITVSNRPIDGSEIHFYPNRDKMPPWNTDTSEPWPEGDGDWVPASIFWSSGDVIMLSGSSPTNTYNTYVPMIVASGAQNKSINETYYVGFNYEVTTSGEPVSGGACAVEFFNSVVEASEEPSVGYRRNLMGIWKTGTGPFDPIGGSYESIGTQGTIIDGSQITTETIEARMIVVGAIHAEHISAEEITGTHISGGSIEVGHLTVGARPRNYGASFEYDYYYFGSPVYSHVLRASAGTLYVTGDSFTSSTAKVSILGKNLTPDDVYYLYVNTEGITDPFAPDTYMLSTGEAYGLEISTGHKYPIAKYVYRNDSTVSGFEIHPIRGMGTYIGGDHLHVGSITADLIQAGAVTAEKIAAETITGGHIYGGGFTGLWYHALAPTGEIWINSGGDSGDIKFYDDSEDVRIELGLDVSELYNEYMPPGLFGIKISDGAMLIDNSTRDLGDWDGGIYNYHYGFRHRYQNTSTVWTPHLDGSSSNYIEQLHGFWSEQRFKADAYGITASDMDWTNVGIETINTYITPPKVGGALSLSVRTLGNGMDGAKRDYNTLGPETTYGHIVQQGSVVGIKSVALQFNSSSSYTNADVIAGAFYANADKNNIGDGYPIGVLAMADGSQLGYEAWAIVAYGDVDLAKSAVSKDSGGVPVYTGGKGIIRVSGMDFVGRDDAVRGRPMFGTAAQPFGEANLTDTGWYALGEAKIKQESNMILFESGFKVTSGETIYAGDMEIKQVGDTLYLGGGAYIDSSKGLLPTGTDQYLTNIGATGIGEEWCNIYLNSGGGAQPGICWNYSYDPQATRYATLYSRNDGVQSRMVLYQEYDGAQISKILLDAKNEYIEFTTDKIVPEADNTTDLGGGGEEFKDLYIDGTAYLDTLEVHDGAEIQGDLTVTGDVNFTDFTYSAVKSISNQTGSLYMQLPGGDIQMSITNAWLAIFVPLDGYIQLVQGQCNIDSYTPVATMAMDVYVDTTLRVEDAIGTVDTTGPYSWRKKYNQNTGYAVSKGEKIVIRLTILGTVQYDHPMYTISLRCTGEGD